VWSTNIELYPVHISSLIAPAGQASVIEPQTERRDDPERMRITRINGIVAYKQNGLLSTLHWVCKC